MAYEKLQIELYNNLKGINQKASEYAVGDAFFLDLRNFGFERPGALVSRPGTADFASFSRATFLVQPQSIYQFIQRDIFDGNNGVSHLIFDSGCNLYSVTTSVNAIFSSLTPNLTTSYPIDYVTANNRLYFANGYFFGEFVRLGNSSSLLVSYFSMPEMVKMDTVSAFVTLHTTLGTAGFTTVFPSGTYAFKFAWARSYSANGPNFSFPSATMSFEYGRFRDQTDNEFVTGGTTNFIAYMSLGATVVSRTAQFRVRTLDANDYTSFDPLASRYNIGSDVADFNILAAVRFPGGGVFTPVLARANVFSGTRYSVDIDYCISANFVNPDGIYLFTLVPSYLEYWKSMLFMAGFSSQPSVVWHSEIGIPNQVLPENFFEVRTDNSDKITCLKAFQNTLMIFKRGSTHELSGVSPETLSLKDVSLQYGCVNNEAAVVWENTLWFVDDKGICEYSGAEISIISDAVETTFRQLDKTKAKAFHIKKRNEVWFAFGSIVLVYDYDVKGWTIYDNLPIEYGVGSNVIEFGTSTTDLAFFNSGTSHWPLTRFRDDLTTDRGSNITLVAQAPFFKRLGDSTTEIFRRFYLDADVPGATTSVTFQMIGNYLSTPSFSTNFFLDSFQKRIDFGFVAKAASPKWTIRSGEKITVNGYAIHARFLRSV